MRTQHWLGRLGLVLGCCGITAFAAEPLDRERHFEMRIRPVLAETCFPCHGGDKVQGGLRVDSREAMFKGGDSGAAIALEDPASTLLIRALRHDEGVSAMPPDPAPPLAPQVIADFILWLQAGAYWPEKSPGFAKGDAPRHWSFQPLSNPTPPTTANQPVPQGSAALDAFLLADLNRRGITPLPAADRRTLLRRATYDLTGLPPSFEELEAFANDPAPNAFDTHVERLLKSPHYGEQWGRHWLDVVRYADTAGENSDHPLPHAWRYRNWVIAAFQRDMPYDQFLREQIAGDLLARRLLEPGAAADPQRYRDLLIATGYWAIARRFGHDIDKDMYLTFEDAIDTLGKSVLGLTLGCARCHSHKYDPVTMEDYYALYGILESTRFSFPGCEPKQQPRDLVPLATPQEQARLEQEYQAPLRALDERLAGLRQEAAAASQALQQSATSATRVLTEGAMPDSSEARFSAESHPMLESVAVQPGELLQLTLLPGGNHGADSTLVEWVIEETTGEKRVWNITEDVLTDFLAANPHPDRAGNGAVWCFLDPRGGLGPLTETVRDLSGKMGLHVWRAGDTPSVFVNSSEQPIELWTRLPPRTLFAHPAQDGPVSLGWISPIAGTVRVRGRVADAHPGGDGVGWRISLTASAAVGDALRSAGERLTQIGEVTRQRAELASRAPVIEVAYAVTEGTPKNSPLQERGDPEKPGREVPRRWLGMFGGDLVPSDQGSGRLELAHWITRPDNPLTARVIVNRVWQYHFGQGLVKTPNDFGTRGQAPSHPELLDWLTTEFLQSGWSIQHLHRVIMGSQAYQRAGHLPDSASAAERESLKVAEQQDPENHGYWRFNSRRLSAEELRDSLLVASGQLDRSPGTAHPFPPEASWGFSQHNPFSANYDSNRRAVYLMNQRNRRHAFLGLFDGADPNASTPLRQETTVPTQALYFMNDPFVHQCAEQATQGLHEITDRDERSRSLYRSVLGRLPTPEELDAARKFLETYQGEVGGETPERSELAAWSAWCRVLLGSNEFLYVE